MAVAVSYPGVYVQELPSGVRTIVGVPTSIAMFIGRAMEGELLRPERCVSFADFERAFSAEYAENDLARSVRLFFDNGGAECYVMRIAGGAVAPADVTLNDETGTPTLTVTAKSAGTSGGDIRVAVSYNTSEPESTFNLEVFRWTKGSGGTLQKSPLESQHTGLSMDPAHPRYCADWVNQKSSLIKLADLNKGGTATAAGYSLSGFALSSGTGTGAAGVTALRNHFIARLALGKKLRLGVAGIAPVPIDLTGLAVPAATANFPAFRTALATAIFNVVAPQLPAGLGANLGVLFIPGPSNSLGGNNATTQLLQFRYNGGDVVVEPEPSDDFAAAFMLGSANGGIEVSRFASRRPAANAVLLSLNIGTSIPSDLLNLASQLQDAFNALGVDGREIPLAGPLSLVTSTGITPPPPMYQDQSATGPDDGRGGLREKLALMAAAINQEHEKDPAFAWTAEVWGSRLAILAAGDKPDNASTGLIALRRVAPPPAPATVVAGVFGTPLQNVRYYPLGTPVAGPFNSVGTAGQNGTAGQLADYAAAYREIDRLVDIFNILVLPRDEKHNDAFRRKLWGPASVFCQQRRAFLLIDPLDAWVDHNAAVDPLGGVNSLRIGLVKDHSALYFPNVRVQDKDKEVAVGPSGAVAGVMARIDGTRGVWKAPAGIEADLRGVIGAERRFSDPENGVMNPRAVNTVRVFPNGIVVWGARTMDGDNNFQSEYKYVPVRRVALFISESLYRGLKWAVFEPNDEPLWAQIRLNVGAFMHDLFRQGAFQGAMPRDAYFVRCDASTTTQNDINLGIVNVIVGFAPLKPAEFVVLYLQQMAGQIQT